MSHPLPNGPTTSTRARQVDDRRHALTNAQRYPKITLLSMLRELERRAGLVSFDPRAGGGPVLTLRADRRIEWTRDELVGEVLDMEYPDWCRFHDQPKPCTVCRPPGATHVACCGCNGCRVG